MGNAAITTDLLGYAAASLVLLAFYLRSMRALRIVAIASNVLFLAYASTANVPPVLLLHALLLPLNAWRLREVMADRPPERGDLPGPRQP